MRFKILLFVLTAAFLGGTLLAAYWFYENIDGPERRAQQELHEREKAGIPGTLPDPAAPLFAKASAALAAGDIDAAYGHLTRLVKVYKESPRTAEARRAIGEINLDRLFSRSPMPGKRDYAVKPGDSLAKIEKGSLTTIPFLYRLNNLTTTVLQPGDRLVYQPLEFEIEVSRRQLRLVVSQKPVAGGDPTFFKEYPVRAVVLPPGSPKGLKTQIHEKTAWLGDKKIGPTDPKYTFARKWLQTTGRPGRPGLLFRPDSERVPDAPLKPGEDPPTPLYGIFLDDGDLDELNVIIRPGTPVIIGE